MAILLEIQPIRNFLNGVISNGAVSDLLMPEGAVREAMNFHFDQSGNATLRKGLTRLGDQISAGNTILGLHQFVDSGSGTDDRVIAAIGAAWYYLSGSTWTSIRSGLTTGLKTRFITFIDRVYGINGTDTNVSWNGSTSSSFDTTNTTSMPAGRFVESFKNRLFVAPNSNRQRLTYSGIADTSGAISWSSGNGSIDFLSDSGDITGLKRAQKTLLVFKPDVIYRLQSVSQTEPDPVLHPGTFSQESIIEGDDGQIYFHAGEKGVFSYNGGLPDLISKPIKDFTDAVPSTFFENVGGWTDPDHLYFSLGDLTIDGISLSNIVVRYTLSSKVWTTYSYGEELRIGTRYDNGTNAVTIVGSTDGNVHTLNSGTTDNGTEISYSLITKFYDFGLRSARKTITKLAVLSDNGAGMNIEWQADNDLPSVWHKIGDMTKRPSQIFKPQIEGFKIRFRISGMADQGPFTFQGWELLKGFINDANE